MLTDFEKLEMFEYLSLKLGSNEAIFELINKADIEFAKNNLDFYCNFKILKIVLSRSIPNNALEEHAKIVELLKNSSIYHIYDKESCTN